MSLILIRTFIYDPPYIRRGSMRVDLWGLGMLAIGMGALQVFFDKGQEEDWFSSHFILALAVVALVMLTAFVIRQLRVDHPLVKFDLFRYRSFATGIIVATALGFILYGGLVLLPLFMQQLLGWSAQTAGFWTSPRGLGAAVCMPLAGLLLGRGWDGRRLMMIGLAAAGFAVYGYSRMTLSSGPWDFFWPQVEQGIGMALIFVPLTVLTMDPIPKQDTGYATSLYSVMRNIGSSMGISFVTTWVARRSQFHQERLAEHITVFNQQAEQAIAQAKGLFHGSDLTAAAQRALESVYRMVQQQAALLSFSDVFHLFAILYLLMIPLALLMRKSRHGGATTAAVH